jgi:hypothetical protein|tara:strand:+ start:729 stop:935 length:207 start_codon:yes stop_codon:yes gene_type:complete
MSEEECELDYEILTPDETAKRLKLTRRELDLAGRRGVIPRIKFSCKTYRYKWEDVIKALEKVTIRKKK